MMHSNLFGKPIIEWNESQKELIYWCAFYRNIFTRPINEQPPKKYLENDYALDRWLEIGEHKQEMQSKLKSKPATDSSQVFVVG